MEAVLTPGQSCAEARSRERLSARVRAASLVFIIAITAGLLYDVYIVDQPWIRVGVAWTLGAIVYLFGAAFDKNPRHTEMGEPCARFLESEHDERRRNYLRIRNRLFLFVPGIVARWFGRAPRLFKGHLPRAPPRHGYFSQPDSLWRLYGSPSGKQLKRQLATATKFAAVLAINAPSRRIA